MRTKTINHLWGDSGEYFHNFFICEIPISIYFSHQCISQYIFLLHNWAVYLFPDCTHLLLTHFVAIFVYLYTDDIGYDPMSLLYICLSVQAELQAQSIPSIVHWAFWIIIRSVKLYKDTTNIFGSAITQ